MEATEIDRTPELTQQSALALLEQLKEVDDVLGIWIVNNNGKISAQHSDGSLFFDFDNGTFFSTCLGAIEMTGKRLHMGESRQVLAEYGNGFLILTSLPQHGVLAVLTEPSPNLGLLRSHIRSQVRAIFPANRSYDSL